MKIILKEIEYFWANIGHLNINQRNFLINILLKLKPEYCLEIGFATGRSCITILASAKPKKFISIDINLDYLENGRKLAALFEKKYKNLKIIESDSQSILIKSFFQKEFPNGIDFIFIDGGHKYNIVYNDLQNTYFKLNKNGIMVIDDYNSGPPDGVKLPGVTTATNDFCKKNNIMIHKWNMQGKGFAILKK